LHEQVVDDQNQQETDPPRPGPHQRILTGLGRAFARRRLHVVWPWWPRPALSRAVDGRTARADCLLSLRGVAVASHQIVRRTRNANLSPYRSVLSDACCVRRSCCPSWASRSATIPTRSV